MKILTLNTHSLIEDNYQTKLQYTVAGIAKNNPDIIALQEVNQSIGAKLVVGDGHYGSPHGLKADNHGLKLYEGLREKDLHYYWLYTPCHVGYSKYDEGLALFSKYPFLDFKEVSFSKARDYTNFQTRKAILARINTGEQSYLLVVTHMGWWQRDEENFKDQWNTLNAAIKAMAKAEDLVLIMGDLNAAAQIKGEGYSYVLSEGYYDTYVLAEAKDDGYTASTVIDGWDSKVKEAIRIDYVLSNKKIQVKNHQVIFNGENEPVVSDHYGIIVEL